jgi:hypothetical protein
MKLFLQAVAAFAVLGVAARHGLADDNKMPKEAAAILAKATEFEVFSLEPSLVKVEGKDTFHGYKTLGKTAVPEKTGKAFVEAIQSGMGGQIDPASCFNPRHGLRATVNGKSVDLVICFQCQQFDVLVGGAEKGQRLLIHNTPAKVLDAVLKEAGIPKAK